MEQLLTDVRHGVRILTKSPGFSATAAMLVALVSFGIVGRAGAPYHRYGDIRYYAEHTKTLRSLAAFGFMRASVATPNGSYIIPTIPASSNYFEMARIHPVK